MKTIPRKKSGRPTNRPDPEELAALYEKYTAPQIGAMFHVADGTVRSWVSRLRKTYEREETSQK